MDQVQTTHDLDQWSRYSLKELAVKRRKCKLFEDQQQWLPEILEAFPVKVDCFKRCGYAIENMEEIVERNKTCFLSDVNRNSKEADSQIFICKQKGDTSTYINEIIQATDVSDSQSILIGSTKRLTRSNARLISSSIIITHKNEKKLIRWGIRNALAVVIVVANKANKVVELRKYSSRSKGNLIISTKTPRTVAKDICNLLERFALSKVKTVCEELYYLIARERATLKDSSPEASNESMQHKCNYNNYDEIGRKQSNPSMKVKWSRLSENGSIGRGIFSPYILDKSYLLEADLSIKESMLEELLALYKSSNVPKTHMPDIPSHTDRKVPKKVSESIFGASSAIKGLGYRYDVLQVSVDVDTSQEVVSSIRKLLKNMQIDTFEIVPMSMKEFSSVGAEIHIDEKAASGSLGCFATNTSRGDVKQCLLLSKHVAAYGKGREGINGKVYDTKTGRLLGHLIQETVTEHGYDIAATALNVDIGTCKTAFRNSKGEKMKGTASKRSNLKGRLRGRKVHIWGAKSRPGKGVITVPYYTVEGMTEHFVQIEDLMDGEKHISQRFAEPGDSGTVACADDPSQEFVHPVSMTIGLTNYTEINEDNKKLIKTKKGKYLAVPLDNGLKELGTRTNSKFNLLD